MGAEPDRKYEQEMRVWEKKHETGLALFKAAMDFAALAIKSIILVNGAASIALLAFLSNTWGKEGSEQVVQLSARSLKFFVFGTAAGVATAAMAYLAQILFTEFATFDGKRNVWGEIIRSAAIAAGFAGVVLFMLGAYAGHDAFITVKAPTPAAVLK